MLRNAPESFCKQGSTQERPPREGGREVWRRLLLWELLCPMCRPEWWSEKALPPPSQRPLLRATLASLRLCALWVVAETFPSSVIHLQPLPVLSSQRLSSQPRKLLDFLPPPSSLNKGCPLGSALAPLLVLMPLNVFPLREQL